MNLLIAAEGCGGAVSTVLWVVAGLMVIAGVITLIRGGAIHGIVLIVLGLLIGPGGVSILC